MHKQSIITKYGAFVMAALILVGLYLISQQNFLLFHGLSELFSIGIACSLFFLAWNARQWLDNNYLLFMGIAYLFIGGLDAVHTLAYRGMGVFAQEYGGNLSTELWIGTRYMHSLSLLVAPLFLRRKLNPALTFIAYSIVTALLLVAIFTGIFPDCYMDGIGLTPFKKISEYVISFILFLSIISLIWHKIYFEPDVLRLLIFSIVFLIVSELAFVFYSDVYGFLNLVGHYFKIIAFYLVYKAIIQTGLTRPYDLLFRDLQKSHEELRRERDKAQMYLDVVGAMVVALDAEQRTTLINKKGCQILGREEKEILGQKWFEAFVPAHMRAETKTVFAQLMTGDVEPVDYFENPIVTAEGEERLIAWHNTVLTEGEQVVGTLSYGEDITERRQIEDRLRESEQLYRTLVNASPDAITVADVEGNITFVSNSLPQIFGYEHKQAFLGQNVLKWIAPTDHARSRQNIGRVLTEGASSGNQYTLVKKNGEHFIGEVNSGALYDAEGNPQGLVSITRDITERHQATDQLAWEAGVNGAMAELAKALISSTDLDHISALVLEHAQRLTGSRFGFVGYIDPQTGHLISPTLTQDIWETCQVPGKSFVFEEFAGLWGWVLTHQISIMTNDPSSDVRSTGTPPGHIPIERFLAVPAMLDETLVGEISLANSEREYTQEDLALAERLASLYALAIHRARSEDALRQAKEDAEAANRAKSVFLANMSHELRTPLNAILGFTQIMRRDRRLDAEQRENLEIVHRSGEHLLALINDVLAMSKIEAGGVTLNEDNFDLHRLIDGLEEMFVLRAQAKGLMLLVERTPEIPRYIYADENKIRQVLMNLLGNAVKFTREGGVTLRLKKTLEYSEAYKESCQEPGEVCLHFEIEDTGPGIAPEELDKLFDPFIQTKSGEKSQQGTGLGLPISQQFVHLMGGEITVESILEKGSLFKIFIPVSLANADEVKEQKQRRRVTGILPNQQTYRLLIVEDRENNRKLLTRLLKPLGFEVREAANGKEAVEIWEAWSPHLILMDMRMPVMDGYEATRHIKATAKGQATVVIALTASAFEEDRTLILSEGCDDFVSKPFRESELFEALTKHLGVKFIYADLAPKAAPRASEEPSLPANIGTATTFPKRWLKELQQATIQADFDRMITLTEQIQASDSQLATVLKDLIHNFEYDQVLKIAYSLEGDEEDHEQ